MSEPSDDGWLVDKAICIRGGESISSDIVDLLGASSGLDSCNSVTLSPILGIEKLRAMAEGGIGNGDAAFDVAK